MKKQSNSKADHAILRSKAEELLKKKPADKNSVISEADSVKLIHEIEVRQVELELQNDELNLALTQVQDAVELYDFAPSGHFTLTKDGEITRLNLCGSQMLGKERSLLQNSKFALFVSNETRPIFNLFFERIYSSNAKESCEVTLPGDGKLLIYVILTGIVARNGKDCLITATDITERRQAEQIVILSEARFRALTQTASYGIYLTDLNGKCIYVNEKWCQMAQLTFEQALNDGWVDAIYEDDRQKVFENWERMIASDGTWGLEYRFGTKEQTIWVYGTAKSYRDYSGEIVGYVGTNMDITKRRLAEEALEKSRLLLRASLESQKDTILLSIDKDYRYLYFNKAHKDVMKKSYNKDIELGMNILECITSDTDRIIAKENYDRAFRGESHSNIRIYGNLKLAYYESFFNPIRGENNEIIGATALARNITRRQAEEDALLNTMALTEATLQSIHNGILVVSSKGTVLKSNVKFAEMWHIPLDMLNVRDDKLLIDFILDQLVDPDGFLAKVTELYNNPEAESKDLIHFRDGRVFERNSRPMYIHGEPEGRVWSFLDITEQKQAEEAIRASEERYQTFIDSTDDIAFLKDEHLNYLLINNAAINFFGKKKEYILGSTDFDLMDRKSANLCLESDMETLKKNSLYISEEAIGACIYETRKFPVTLRNGTVGIGCYVRDITERRNSEAALRDAHRRMEGIIEGTHVGSWEWNVQTGEVAINEVWAEIIGYTLDELSPISIKTWERLAHPDDLIKSDLLLEKHFTGKLEYYNCECRMKHKDGHWVWVLDRGRVITRTSDGAPLMMFGTHTDITSSKQLEAALRESESNLRAVFNATDESIFLVSDEETVLDLNEIAAHRMGSSRDKVIGRKINELLPHDLAASRRPFIDRLLSDRIPVEFEDERESRIMRNHLYPILDADGKLLRMAVFSRDVTEYKAAQNEMAELNSVLSKLNHFSMELAMISSQDSLEEFILKQIKEFSGASVAIYSKYSQSDHTATVKYIEMEPGLLKKAVLLIGKPIKNIPSIISDEMYRKITTDLVGMCKTLHEASFGSVPRPVGAAIEALLNVDHFIGLAYMLDGELYGTSLLAMKKGQPDPPIQLLKNFVAMASISLRRSQANKALFKSEEKFRSLVETSSDIIWETNTEGLYTYVSPKVEAVLGYKQEEMIGRSPFEFMLPDISDHLRKISDKIVASKKPFSGFVNINLSKDGREITLETSGVPVFDKHLKLIGYRGIDRDITERSQAQKAVMESEEKYHTVFSTEKDALFLIDRETFAILDVNDAACSLYGYSYEEMLKMKSSDMSAQKEDSDRIIREFKDNIGLRNHIKKDGTIFPVDISASKFTFKDRPVLLAAIRDVSERVKMDAIVFENESRLSTIYDTVGDVIFHLAVEGDNFRFLSVNKAFCTSTGLREDMIVGKLVGDVIPEPSYSMVLEKYRKAIRENSTVRWEEATEYPTGLIIGDVSITPVLDINGNCTHLVGSVHDITDRKHLEEELSHFNKELELRVEQRTQQLENANRELEAFSYSVAHNLRSPLRGIDGWSLALQQDFDHLLDDKGRTFIYRVRKEAQQMGNLIDDLLKLAQVTHIMIKETNVDISALVQTIVNQFTIAHPLWKFEFKTEPGISVQGDLSLLQIVLTNLIDNAFKFTGHKEVAHIEFGKTEIDHKQTFFIRDNGIGFNMNYAKKIFGPFQRLHKPSEFPGSGIGLATVQRIISRLGGRIWAESQPGEGATFYFTLN
jgi:PAS domain S-box-containing protein